MTKINNDEDFSKIINQITSFSHAYILNTNNLSETTHYAKIFAKKIILEKLDNQEEIDDIIYKIDHDIFDDLYIVNPVTQNINNEEIVKLLKYMETKSIRNDGRRVYIINGLERITRDISNKILKFLEEPEDNIYAILITNEIDKVLPTIISRTQVINITLEQKNIDDENISQVHTFLNKIIDSGEKTIAYTNELLHDIISSREEMYNFFDNIEKIISNGVNKKIGNESIKVYENEKIYNLNLDKIIVILDITNKLKQLIKKNININLLIDRYIIEVGKEL